MGASEVGEVDEHESVESSVREHGFERDVVGRELRQSVLQETAKFRIVRGLTINNVGNVGVEDLQVVVEALQGLLEITDLRQGLDLSVLGVVKNIEGSTLMLGSDVVEGKRHEMVVNNIIAEGDGQAVECVDVNSSLAQISANHQVNRLLVHVATEEFLEKNSALTNVFTGRIPSNDNILRAKTMMDTNHLAIILNVHRDLSIEQKNSKSNKIKRG